MRILTPSTLLALLLLPAILPADTIHLRNGDTLVGEIIGQDAGCIRLQTRFTVMNIPKSRITRIVKTEKPEELINIYLKSGAIYRGTLLKQTGEYIMIRRKSGEKRIFLKENLARIDWNTDTIEKTKPGSDDRKAALRSRIDPDKNPLAYRLAGMSRGEIRLQSMWRSALLPSWGQFWHGRDTMGYVWAGGMGVALTGMLTSWISYRIEESAWDAGDHSQSRYDRMKRRSDVFRAFSIAALSVWILNIADAGVFSPKSPINLALSTVPNEPGLQITFNLKF